MGTTAQKIQYLDGTKTLLKDSINLTGAGITSSDTFRSYATKLKQGLINALNDNGETIISNFPKVSGKGSNLSLTPTYEAPMGISVYGDTYQNGTPTPSSPIPINNATGLQNVNVCGKNLLNIQTIVKGRLDNGVIGYASDTSELTLNDNSYSFTTTKNYRGIVSDFIEVNENTTYVLSTKNDISVNFNFFDTDKTFLSTANGDGGTSLGRVVTTPTNTKYVRLYNWLNSAGSITVENPQLEVGSSSTAYEKFNGTTYGINLGKNLCYEVLKPANENLRFKFNNSIQQTFTISFTSNETLSNNSLYLEIDGTSYGNAGGITGTANARVSKTITLSDTNYSAVKNGTNVSLLLYKNGANFTIPNDAQVESGSQMTDYSPYFTPIELNKIGDYEDSIKKSTGKNLFGGTLYNGITNQDGSFESSNTRITNAYQTLSNTFYLKQGTYTLSIANLDYCTVLTKDINGNRIDNFADSWKSLPFTFTTTQDGYLYFSARKSDNSNITASNYKAQVEQNNQATSYEPYGKVWYITKNIGKVVLDGTEDWTLNNNYTNNSRFTNNDDILNKTERNVYCNYFVKGTAGQDTTNIDINGSTGKIMITIPNSIATSTSVLQTWLSSNNVSVIYILNTPTTTEITNEELIKELESIKSKNGTTNISVSSEYLPVILGCSALKVEE